MSQVWEIFLAVLLLISPVLLSWAVLQKIRADVASYEVLSSSKDRIVPATEEESNTPHNSRPSIIRQKSSEKTFIEAENDARLDRETAWHRAMAQAWAQTNRGGKENRKLKRHTNPRDVALLRADTYPPANIFSQAKKALKKNVNLSKVRCARHRDQTVLSLAPEPREPRGGLGLPPRPRRTSSLPTGDLEEALATATVSRANSVPGWFPEKEALEVSRPDSISPTKCGECRRLRTLAKAAAAASCLRERIQVDGHNEGSGDSTSPQEVTTTSESNSSSTRNSSPGVLSVSGGGSYDSSPHKSDSGFALRPGETLSEARKRLVGWDYQEDSSWRVTWPPTANQAVPEIPAGLLRAVRPMGENSVRSDVPPPVRSYSDNEASFYPRGGTGPPRSIGGGLARTGSGVKLPRITEEQGRRNGGSEPNIPGYYRGYKDTPTMRFRLGVPIDPITGAQVVPSNCPSSVPAAPYGSPLGQSLSERRQLAFSRLTGT